MKRLTFSLLLLIGIALHCNSQIKVADNNNVGIGATAPVSKLSVGGNGYSNTTFYSENSTTLGYQRAGYFYKSISGTSGEGRIPLR